jgi:Na+-transporting NADH:ubiquinone oxidoreductase subunit NqrC
VRWRIEIHVTTTQLYKRRRLYIITNYMNMMIIGFTTALLIALTAFTLATTMTQNKTLDLTMAIILLVLQLINAVFAVNQNILNPDKKKDLCKELIIRYNELTRELDINIERLSTDTEDEENSQYDEDRLSMYDYTAIALSNRKQLIDQSVL